MYARDGKVFIVTDNKQVGIDKSTPVVYPLKVESGLNTVMSRSLQVILHIRAIGPNPFEEIQSATDLLELDGVQLGMFTSLDTLQSLHNNEVPILLEVVVEEAGKLEDAAARFEGLAPYVEAFILNFDKNGIGWENLRGAPMEQLQELCRHYPVILSLDFHADTLAEALDILQPYGISVRGGEEEKVGFKSFDELDELFEALETFE